MNAQSASPVRVGVRQGAGAAATVTVIGGMLVVGGQPVSAASFVVTNADDAGAGSLRQAVIDANGSAGLDTITFAPGLTGSTITLTSGSIGISDDLTLTGLGEAALTLTTTGGDILYLYNGAALSMSDITLTGGDSGIATRSSGDLALTAVTVTGATYNGVEFYGTGSDVTIVSSTLDGNGAHGFYVANPPVLGIDAFVDDLTVTDTSISGNGSGGLYVWGVVTGGVTLTGLDASTNAGWGVFVEGATGPSSIVNSTMSDNEDVGLALYDARSAVVITGTTVTSNGTNDSGVDLRSVDGDVTVTDSAFIGNSDIGLYVGAVTGDVTIARTTATDNGSNGLYIRDVTGNVTVTDSDLSRNLTGGLYIQSNVGGDVTIERVSALDNVFDGLTVHDVQGAVSISDSSVAGSGGIGIHLANNVGVVSIARSTVSGSADEAVVSTLAGGELRVGNSTLTGNGDAVSDAVIQTDGAASVRVAHSTVTGNGIAGMTAPVIDVVDAVVSVDHSVVTGNNGAGVFAVSGAGSVVVSNSLTPVGSGSGASNVESNAPLLGPLGDNGGLTETLLPLAGSPVIDAGNPAFVGPPAVDQRGLDRVVRTVDIGAVEVQFGAAVTSLAPSRFVDTRANGDTFDDLFQAEGKRVAGSEYRVKIAGRGGVPVGAKAVVVNVTAVAGEGVGFVTVHPCLTTRPLASSLNFTSGVNVANEIVAPLNAAGELCLYTSAAAHLVVDAVGFVGADSATVPVAPSRYLDTRASGDTFDGVSEKGGRTSAGGSVTLKVAGRGAVPADAAAVIVNVTAVGPTETGFVTVHPCAPVVPNASSLNYVAGVNRANEIVASVDASGNICLFTSSSIDLLVDVVGYVRAGSSFNAVTPRRFLDSRPVGETIDGLQEKIGKRSAGSQLELQIAGRPGVPVGAKAVVINVTAVSPEAVGFVTVHPCLATRPLASSLNYVAGVNGANELIAILDNTGKICLYTDQAAHLLVDVVGYLS